MKVLILNPWINATHRVIEYLTACDVGVLLSASADEAFQIFQIHESSLSIVVVHCDKYNSHKDQGLSFIEKVKRRKKDFPILLTTFDWSDEESVKHQETEYGANAYLKAPFSGEKLYSLVCAVLGEEDSKKNFLPDEIKNLGLEIFHKPGEAPFLKKIIDAQKPKIKLDNTGEMSAPNFELPINENNPSSGAVEDLSNLYTRSELQPHEKTSISLKMPNIEATSSGFILKDGSIEHVNQSGGDNNDGSRQVTPPPFSPPPRTAQGGQSHLRVVDDLELEPFERLDVSENSAVQELSSSGFDDSTFQTGDSENYKSKSREEQTTATPPPFDRSKLLDVDASKEIPYLFEYTNRAKQDEKSDDSGSDMFFNSPLGDAIIPGGATKTPDVKTLKKYLILREQDVSALSAKLKLSHEQNIKQEASLQKNHSEIKDLKYRLTVYKDLIDAFEEEKSRTVEASNRELKDYKFKVKAKIDRAKLLEKNLKEASEEMGRLKDRVQVDIRKIRVREKELENRLEIMKKDAETLIASRENKIIELKRKLDLFEFNMDLLQHQYAREKELTQDLRARLDKASRAMRIAEGLLESEESTPQELDDDSENAQSEASEEADTGVSEDKVAS